MSTETDLVICNQAKALEGMRQRLKSHGRKLTDRQRQIDRMEEMIARRDERIAHLDRVVVSTHNELKKLQEQVPESYQSELTRKCEEVEAFKERSRIFERRSLEARQELVKQKAIVAELTRIFAAMGYKIEVIDESQPKTPV